MVLESRLGTAMVVSGVGCLANAGDMPLSGGDDGCLFLHCGPLCGVLSGCKLHLKGLSEVHITSRSTSFMLLECSKSQLYCR